MDRDSLFEELREDGNYSGPCELVLDNPVGQISGNATVRVAGESRTEAEISIEGFHAPPEYNNNLIAFLNASPPRSDGDRVVVSIPATTNERRIASLTVKTDAGTFTATSGILSNPIFWGLTNNETISVVLNDLVFSRRTDATAKYWFVPLQGPFAEFYRPRAAQPHVLALDGESCYISFFADGRSCGVQIFGKDKSPKHALATYDAVAFGELCPSVDTLDRIWASLPTGLQNALSFSIGADVTAPWIEVRGENGQLIRRFFYRMGRRSTKDGFQAFVPVNEFEPSSGIAPFLKAFFSTPSEKRESLIVPLNLIRSGSPGSFNIDDSITDLIKALDNLCKMHGLTTQDLFNRLETDNQQRVHAILDQARTQLLATRSDNTTRGRQDQTDILNVIVSKVASATTTSRDFGIAVKDLLKRLNLHDAEVLVLREVNYTGSYQASTNPWSGNYSVNRVTPTMDVKDLGLSELPTHI
jgi:hypothetical protein